MILVGDLGQLSPIKYKPIYVGNTIGEVLWKEFNIVVTLDKIFRQEGRDPKKHDFWNLLFNIRNYDPILIVNWELLTSIIDINLSLQERNLFDSTI